MGGAGLVFRLGMTNLLPGLVRSFGIVLCAALLGCENPAPQGAAPDSASEAVDPLVAVATAAATAVTTEEPLVTAEIMDIAAGASGGLWAVAVRFSAGECKPCIIEVTDRSSGKLLTRDEVRSLPGGNGIHETQFQYRGSRENLHVKVVDGDKGDTLDEAGN